MQRDLFRRLRYRLVPDHIIGEILSKAWVDNAIPVAILILVLAVFGSLIPGLVTPTGLSSQYGALGELILVTLGMTIVMLGGGIDLSVGAVFALANVLTLLMFNYLGWPIGVVILLALGVGAVFGLVNGFLVGFLRLRAFLTTLATLIIARSIADILVLNFAVAVSSQVATSDFWNFVSFENILTFPVALIAALVLAIIGHIFLTRLRPGWRVLAVGGSRRSAYNAGVPVRSTVMMTYIISGVLAALSGVFYAARLNAAGSDTGVGLETLALTAAVLGGNSLGGGRGSVAKAVLGAITTLILYNSLIRLSLPTGGTSFFLGLALLIAVAIDVYWLKSRGNVLTRVYVSPTYLDLPAMPAEQVGATSPYAINDKLRGADEIGLGQLDGPEDVILDAEDNLYTGSRHGDVVRLIAPDYRRSEVFAHIGGQPLGMAFDRDGNLICCVAGMGLYMVKPDRSVTKLSDETNRTLFSVIDDSRIRLADDIDIASDGRIFFSEATIRYDMSEWTVDGQEARGNGRIICFDPRSGSTRTVISKLLFPNGICMAHDGSSFFFAETWACRISRYWFAGPQKGKREVVIGNLPGYPDNINRASDGNYWVALVGMRTPAFDLALRMPGFRRTMVQRVAPDEWLFPNVNAGCVVKFDDSGHVLGCLWDKIGSNHPMITSMREHKGFLYLGGLNNNRIGRYRIPDADPNWTGIASYWGAGK